MLGQVTSGEDIDLRPPVGIDLRSETSTVREAILKGIESQGKIAEIYPVGGVAAGSVVLPGASAIGVQYSTGASPASGRNVPRPGFVVTRRDGDPTTNNNNNNNFITSTMDALSDMITPLLGGVGLEHPIA